MEKNQNKQKIQALKELLLEKLNTTGSLTLDELKSTYAQNELNPALRELAREKKAAVWRRFLKKADGQDFRFETGTVKQFGPGRFILEMPSGDEAYISSKAAKTVLDGDEVSCFLITSPENGSVEAIPSDVIRRPKPQVWVRAFSKPDGSLAWSMENRAEAVDVELTAPAENAKEGDIWKVRISEHKLLRFANKATPMARLGNQADKGIESIYAYTTRFLDRGMQPPCPERLSDSTDKADRKDVRSLPLVTIDGESTRDFDDAVYAKEHVNGSFTLSVHIADVSAFVPRNSALDVYAQEQMTSVYLPHFVNPMFPELLSNGMSSLKPGEDRFSLACNLEISEQGEVTDIKFERALMHSAERLTYSQAQKAFEGKDIGVLPEVADSLAALSKVARILRDRGFAEGRFDMGEDESGWVLGADGKIDHLTQKTRMWSEKVIEECMLAANKAAATLIGNQLPGGMFRNHWGMSEDDVSTFMGVAVSLGLAEEGVVAPGRFEFIKVLEQAKEKGCYGQMRSELLSRLSSAQYSASNEGHYSLAADAYCHFTSPIRRYADLICHRLIKSVIDGQEPAYSKEELVGLASKATDLSSRSGQTEGEARKLLMCEFLSRQIPLQVQGRVQSVGERGCWITCQIGEGAMDVMCPLKVLKGAGWTWMSAPAGEKGGYWNNEEGIKVVEGLELKMKIDSVNVTARRTEASPDVKLVAKPSITP